MADDYGSTISTTGSVSVGGSTPGSIETAGDTDWFRITLTAGQTYQFDLRGSASGGGTLPDPFLRLRDSAGNEVDLVYALAERLIAVEIKAGQTLTLAGTVVGNAVASTPSSTTTSTC